MNKSSVCLQLPIDLFFLSGVSPPPTQLTVTLGKPGSIDNLTKYWTLKCSLGMTLIYLGTRHKDMK